LRVLQNHDIPRAGWIAKRKHLSHQQINNLSCDQMLFEAWGLRVFSFFSVLCYLSLGFISDVSSVLLHSLGNSKAAAHVAVDLQCWFTVKHAKNKERCFDIISY